MLLKMYHFLCGICIDWIPLYRLKFLRLVEAISLWQLPLLYPQHCLHLLLPLHSKVRNILVLWFKFLPSYIALSLSGDGLLIANGNPRRKINMPHLLCFSCNRIRKHVILSIRNFYMNINNLLTLKEEFL